MVLDDAAWLPWVDAAIADAASIDYDAAVSAVALVRVDGASSEDARARVSALLRSGGLASSARALGHGVARALFDQPPAVVAADGLRGAPLRCAAALLCMLVRDCRRTRLSETNWAATRTPPPVVQPRGSAAPSSGSGDGDEAVAFATTPALLALWSLTSWYSLAATPDALAQAAAATAAPAVPSKTPRSGMAEPMAEGRGILCGAPACAAARATTPRPLVLSVDEGRTLTLRTSPRSAEVHVCLLDARRHTHTHLGSIRPITDWTAATLWLYDDALSLLGEDENVVAALAALTRSCTCGAAALPRQAALAALEELQQGSRVAGGGASTAGACQCKCARATLFSAELVPSPTPPYVPSAIGGGARASGEAEEEPTGGSWPSARLVLPLSSLELSQQVSPPTPRGMAVEAHDDGSGASAVVEQPRGGAGSSSVPHDEVRA